MKKALLASAAIIFAVWFGHYVGYSRCKIDTMERENAESRAKMMETKPVVPPVTDWKKFYIAIESGDVNAMEWSVGVQADPDSEYNRCTLFLVDGDRWYEVEDLSLWSCGGPHEDGELYRSYVLPRDKFRKMLKTVPSDDAKFVVVGPGRAKLVEVEIKYRERKR